jgi:hypothetical protein
MGKATRSLSGASQKKYFRDLIGSVEGIPPSAAETLRGTCEREIAQVRVRLPIPERGTRGKPEAKSKAAGRPESTTASEPAAVAGFDPFAFSVVVVITKEGRDGLSRKLQDIATTADLRALAKAQHLALPDGDLTAADLRGAIIEGALQRIANRKAAAS